MLSKMMRLVSIAALLLAAMLWSDAPNLDLKLRFVVALSTLFVVPFAVSLTALKTQPLLSIPSITDHPRSEAL